VENPSRATGQRSEGGEDRRQSEPQRRIPADLGDPTAAELALRLPSVSDWLANEPMCSRQGRSPSVEASTSRSSHWRRSSPGPCSRCGGTVRRIGQSSAGEGHWGEHGHHVTGRCITSGVGSPPAASASWAAAPDTVVVGDAVLTNATPPTDSATAPTSANNRSKQHDTPFPDREHRRRVRLCWTPTHYIVSPAPCADA
jgi:hypothetical protein